MKKTSMYIVLLAVFALVACGKESPPTPKEGKFSVQTVTVQKDKGPVQIIDKKKEKKEEEEKKKGIEYYSLKYPKAVYFNACIIAQVTAGGDTSAIDAIYLELKSESKVLDSYEGGFKPDIVEKASDAVIKTINSKKTVTIQYCPKELPKGGYRWRFRGSSHVGNAAVVVTPTQFVRTLTAN